MNIKNLLPHLQIKGTGNQVANMPAAASPGGAQIFSGMLTSEMKTISDEAALNAIFNSKEYSKDTNNYSARPGGAPTEEFGGLAKTKQAADDFEVAIEKRSEPEQVDDEVSNLLQMIAVSVAQTSSPDKKPNSHTDEMDDPPLLQQAHQTIPITGLLQPHTDHSLEGEHPRTETTSVDRLASNTSMEFETDQKSQLSLKPDNVQTPQSGKFEFLPKPLQSFENMPTLNNVSATPAPDTVAPKSVTVDIPQRVGTAQWESAVGQKIVWMTKSDISSAVISINPPELGPMTITVRIEKGEAVANFVSEQPEVRKALEESLPKLREVMQEAGINLTQTTVSQESEQPKKNQFDTPSGQRERNRNSSQNVKDDENLDVMSNPEKRHLGLVDTFA